MKKSIAVKEVYQFIVNGAKYLIEAENAEQALELLNKELNK